ncbi:MAG: SUMF1/EgtB/PvdO family nonheme iron enzyme [Chthoniobacteraceae bacterium]
MRILLVDDETAVIQTLLATLKTLPGHDVRVATSGDKALESASAIGGLDLLITDVVMDPMNGFTLRDKMVERYPSVRTVFISGYDLSDYAAQVGDHQVLQKPFDPQTLLAAVHRELAAIAPVAARVNTGTAAVAAVPDMIFQRAQPKAVPTAQPTVRAVPAAVPVARPVQPTVKVVPAGQPTVRAVPVAQPGARPVPVAKPAAVPRAPLAVAVAASAPPPPVAPPVSIPAPPPGAGESLIGQTLGSYQIVSYLGEGRLGSAYAAVQISINRPVGLKVLDPVRAQDEAIRSRFISDARAKAHIQHPSILAVYEAGEADGRFFFAREYVDGQSLAETAASGAKLPEASVLKILKIVAEGFVYLHMQNLPHRPIDASRIFVGVDGNPRLANIAVQIADEHQTVPQELQSLGRVIASVVSPQSISPGLQNFLVRLQQSPASGVNAWGQVIQAARALEPKNVPTAAAKISAQDEAAINAVEAARKSQRRSFWLNVASISALFIAVVFLALKRLVFTNERKIQTTVKVPAGAYKLPGGGSFTVDSDFWIDKYEVTLAQYQRFLDHLEKHPLDDQEFRHPKMPRHLEHRPEHWDIYYLNAQQNRAAHSVPIDLNCPALTVTWWDAYAYAKWLGKQTGTERDLPTAEEWEVAASGGKGFKYPWGNEIEEGRANLGTDHNPNKASDKAYGKGDKDGYNFWSDVDAKGGDRSPLGVVGMGGNVAEWTGSWTKDNKFPILKGGDFSHPPTPIDKSISDHDANKGEEWIGFRTISRTKPADAE